MRRAFTLLLATPCALLAACGDNSAVETGIDIPLTPTTEDLYSVGALSGEEWENFAGVDKVAFDASGNLHILDAAAKRIVVVDREGGFLREIGGEGEGPGELRSPSGFEILRDGRIVVYDIPRTWELYDPRGVFLEDVTFDIAAGAPGSLLMARPDGRLVSRGGWRLAGPGQESEEVEDPHLRDIELFALDGSGMEVLYRAWNLEPTALDEELTFENELGEKVMSVEVTRMRGFEPGLHLGMLSDGRLAVVDSMGYRVKLIGLDGRVVGAIERPIAPEPVTERVKEAERELRREAYSDDGTVRMQMAGSLGEHVAEQYVAKQRELIDDMVFTDVIPAIADMAVGPGDLIWVARKEPGTDWPGPVDVLTAEGGYLGTLPADGPPIPDAFGLDGLMAYIETGEMDVPIVRVIRLVTLDSGRGSRIGDGPRARPTAEAGVGRSLPPQGGGLSVVTGESDGVGRFLVSKYRQLARTSVFSPIPSPRRVPAHPNHSQGERNDAGNRTSAARNP